MYEMAIRFVTLEGPTAMLVNWPTSCLMEPPWPSSRTMMSLGLKAAPWPGESAVAITPFSTPFVWSYQTTTGFESR